MEFYPIDLAIHAVNIVVLYLILRSLLFNPVCKFMAAREARVQAQLEGAAQAKQDAEQLRASYDEKLAGVQETCEQLLAEGRKQGAEAAQKALDEAHNEATQLIRKARTEAEEQKLRTLDAAKGDLAELAVDMAGRILRFEDIVKKNVAEGAKEKYGTATGTLKTAQDCSEAELRDITGKLEALLGCHLHLQHSVDAKLLGGFAAFIDGKVYDFSYAAQLGQMKRKLS